MRKAYTELFWVKIGTRAKDDFQGACSIHYFSGEHIKLAKERPCAAIVLCISALARRRRKLEAVSNGVCLIMADLLLSSRATSFLGPQTQRSLKMGDLRGESRVPPPWNLLGRCGPNPSSLKLRCPGASGFCWPSSPVTILLSLFCVLPH